VFDITRDFSEEYQMRKAIVMLAAAHVAALFLVVGLHDAYGDAASKDASKRQSVIGSQQHSKNFQHKTKESSKK
jgi:hypothetical protein